MHEDLIKRLREKAARFDYDGWVDTVAILKEAADAIEDLSREIDIDNAAMTAMDAATPRWIPVTERLPEKAEQIADLWFSADVIGKDEVTIRKAYYNFTAGVWLDANCEMEWDSITHWMPMPPKEETE